MKGSEPLQPKFIPNWPSVVRFDRISVNVSGIILLYFQTAFMMFFPKSVNNSNSKPKKIKKTPNGISGGQTGMYFLKRSWKWNTIRKSITFLECMFYREKISWLKIWWRWERKVPNNTTSFHWHGTCPLTITNLKLILTQSQKEKLVLIL